MISTSEPKEIAKYRSLKGAWRAASIIYSAVGMLLVISFTYQFRVEGNVIVESAFHAALVAIFLSLSFIWYPATRHARRDRPPWYDVVAAVVGFIAPFSIFPNALQIALRGQVWNPPLFYIIAGIITLVLLLEASRRAVGLPLAVVVGFFSIYPIFSHLMPGFMIGIDIPWQKLVGYHFLGSESIFGLPVRVVGRIVIGFLVFAAALQATGGGTFFINLALSIFGRVRGGTAKVSVFSSALFASISGSVASNVLTTGSFTIPAMKKAGFPPNYAAAIEACASTGGVFTPPVMGVVAFVMAEFLGVPYVDVCLAAAVPAILFYWSLFLQVDAYAAKKGIKGLAKEDKLPSFWQTLKGGWLYLIALIILVYFTAYLGLENRAGWYAAGLLLLLSMITKATRLTPQGFIQFIESTGRLVMEITVITAAVGLIIGAFIISGLGLSFAEEIIALSGEHIYLTLFLGALVSFILGMGMPSVACYIFLALILAPGLVKAGFYPLGVHMFILYWGMLSYITPPVCIGVYVAATLAGADPMRTAFQAVRLAIVLFFIPFFFVIEPALVLHGSVLTILQAIAFCLLGLMLISWGLEGYVLGVGRVNFLVRITLVISGAMIAYPELLTTFIGLGMGAVVILILILRKPSLPKEATLERKVKQGS